MDTLLIIDMQNAWFEAPAQRHDKEGVIARLNLAARTMREHGARVIFVRHADESAPKGSTPWQILSELDQMEGDGHVDKTACDSFAGTNLLDLLQTQGSRRLFIGGLATEFCVDTTLRAALSHGFDVVALSDAHTTGNRPHLTAAQIIEHHNWVWTHIAAPFGRSITVVPTQQAVSTM